MNKPSIFEKDNKVKSNFMKWIDIGDKIEGTLVSKRVVFNTLSKKDQVIYEIKTTDGEYWNVGGKPGIDAQMKRVRVGQIVGFEYIEERPAKIKGYDPTKIIQIYANPKVTDEEWLKQQEEEGETFQEDDTDQGEIRGDDDEGDVDIDEALGFKKPQRKLEEAEEESQDATDNDSLLEIITELAQKKLGAKGSEDIMKKVMEATELAFIDVNLQKIVDALDELPEPRKATPRKK